MSDPRGHHLLAKLYQRGFATTKGPGHVRLVVKKTGKNYTCSIEDAFKERDWNAFTDEEGKRRTDFEEILAEEIDDPAGEGFAALRRGEFPLSEGQRDGIGYFIAAQLQRGRYVRNATEEFIGDIKKKVVALRAQHSPNEWWEEHGGRAPTAEEREEFKRGEGEVGPSKREALEAIAVVDDVAPLLLARNWVLVEFSEPCLFTSEAPIWMSGAGIGYSEEIRLPITPELALLLVIPNAGLEEGKRELDAAVAANVNLGTLTNPHAETLLLSPMVEKHALPPFEEKWEIPRQTYDYLVEPRAD